MKPLSSSIFDAFSLENPGEWSHPEAPGSRSRVPRKMEWVASQKRTGQLKKARNGCQNMSKLHGLLEFSIQINPLVVESMSSGTLYLPKLG